MRMTLDVAEEEITEDMHKMQRWMPGRLLFLTSIVQMVKKRLGWLIVLFVGQTLTALTMGQYEELLKIVFLSFFVPLIISSGGNSGAQAATLIIRALATDDIKADDWKKVFFRELSSGLVLGILIGILGFVTLLVWDLTANGYIDEQSFLTALVIALSLLSIVLFGNFIGAMLPFILSRLGFDPAVSSAPFVLQWSMLVELSFIFRYYHIFERDIIVITLQITSK